MDTLAPTSRVRAYAPELVERVLDDLASERLRLERALETALQRGDAAKARLATANALRYRIGDLVLDAERRCAQHDADTDRAVAELLAATDAEVDAAVAAARAEVARRKLVAAVRHIADEPDGPVAPLSLELDELDDLDEQRAIEVG